MQAHEIKSVETTVGDIKTELEDGLKTMASLLADYPEEVVVNGAWGKGFVAFEVICNEKDTGALVGRRGKYADAIRTIMMAAGAVRNVRVTVQIVSRDQDSMPAR